MTDFEIQIPQKIEGLSKLKQYREVGHCIYCGHDRVQLYPEHIIPFGIAGDSLVLPKASCKRCGNLTGKNEGYILRHAWWPFRARIGAPTSKPKERPKTFRLRKVRRESGGQFVPTETLDLSPEEYPISLAAVRLTPPGILAGRPATTNFEGELWVRYVKSDWERFSFGDQEGHFIAPINPEVFCRMLARIAHAYAVAEFGYGNFRPYLRKLIRGRNHTPTFWVGGHWEIPPPEAGVLHFIAKEEVQKGNQRLVVVRLRLFAFFGTPMYQIVVGEL
jgi:hypothetical protein